MDRADLLWASTVKKGFREGKVWLLSDVCVGYGLEKRVVNKGPGRGKPEAHGFLVLSPHTHLPLSWATLMPFPVIVQAL